MNTNINNAAEVKKILVPICIGNEGAIALKQAMIFQKTFGSEITLLHIVPKTSIFNKIIRPARIEKNKQKARKNLTDFTKNFFGGEIPAFIHLDITSGNLIQKILYTAEKIKSDLIIIKKRNRIASRLGIFKNENADKLISGAVCPVLTIPGNNNEKGIKDILIPVDITKKIENKIAWVKYLALMLDAKVHVVTVIDLDIPPITSLAYQKALMIEKSIKEVGLEVNVVVLRSKKQSMHEAVLSHIADLNPDMVLMMTHQESILFDNYIGKFAAEVIHKTNRPVFSLVPRKENLMINLLDSLSNSKEKPQKNILDLQNKSKYRENVYQYTF